MWKFKKDLYAPLTIDNANWSHLQQDPATVIPYRIVVTATVFTVFLLVAGGILGLPAMRMVIGYWIGILGNLINFRGIVISANNYLEKAKMGQKSSILGGFLLRQGVAAIALYFGISLGVWAMLMTFIGLSMVKIVVNLDQFLNFKIR